MDIKDIETDKSLKCDEYIKIINEYKPNENLPNVELTYNQKRQEIINMFKDKEVIYKESLLVGAIDRELEVYKSAAIRELKNCVEIMKKQGLPKEQKKISFIEKLQKDAKKLSFVERLQKDTFKQQEIESIEYKQKVSFHINNYYEFNRKIRGIDLEKQIEQIVLNYMVSTPYREPKETLEFIKQDMKMIGYSVQLKQIEKVLANKDKEIDER